VAEKAGIPAVAIAGTSFLPLVHLLGKQEGVPGVRVAEYGGTFSIESAAVMREKLQERTFNQIVEGLTGPASTTIGSTAESGGEEVVFTGTFEEINEAFARRRLTDGLPIIPPTVKKVEEFLKFTDRPADEEIAILQPGNLRATPRIIAANGVMAGCRPEHMPILVAAVEAIADQNYNLEQIGTTGGVNPFLLINGPIIRQLGIEFDIGLVSRGPNPSIGRALGLIIRNVAGFRPAEQYMGTFGYIMPFVLAEDEEQTPWAPYQAEHGLEKGKNTVTAGATQSWGFQAFPSGTEPEGHLKAICQDIVKRIVLWGPLTHKDSQMLTVLVTPPVARALAHGGYSKQDVQDYFFENSRVSIRDIELILKYGYCCGETETIRGLIEKKMGIPEQWAHLGQDDTVPILVYPGVVNLVVCGDRTRNKSMALHAAYVKPSTREIRLPSNWDEMIGKRPVPASAKQANENPEAVMIP
jgi:hypothetical protein